MTKTDNRWTLEEFEMQIADMMDAAYKTPVRLHLDPWRR